MAQTKTQSNIEIEGRVPPHSLELERNLLGGLMIDNNLIDIVSSYHISEQHFYSNANAIIYKTILDLRDKHQPADLITVSEELNLQGQLDAIGGPLYLTDLTTSFTSSETVSYSAEKIIEYFIKRDTINLTAALRDKALDPACSLDELLTAAENGLMSIGKDLSKKDFVVISKSINETMEYIDTVLVSEDKIKVSGIPSGFEELDEITGGFQKSELITIASRPSHGKTAFCLSVAKNSGIDYKKRVGIFSIEMSERELALRFICNESKIDLGKVKTGRLREPEWLNVIRHTGRLINSDIKIFIDDSSPLTLTELRSKARRLKSQFDIEMIMIDYLQLLELGGRQRIDRYLEVGQITRGLKSLAKELDIPVVALSQLSRKVEERGGIEKRPMLSDLRESGSIEQDSDVVIFINRPEMYMKPDHARFKDYHGLAEIIVAKQRNGPLGEVKLSFVHQYAGFEPLSKDAPPDNIIDI